VDMDSSGYVMGGILMQGDNLVCHNFEMFHGGVMNYPIDDKEWYALVQGVKKWKNYLIGKETIPYHL